MSQLVLAYFLFIGVLTGYFISETEDVPWWTFPFIYVLIFFVVTAGAVLLSLVVLVSLGSGLLFGGQSSGQSQGTDYGTKYD